MNLRPFDAGAGDADRLDEFRCSTGAPFEDDVEAWIRTDAIGWANDLPRARFQRRTLALIEDGEATHTGEVCVAIEPSVSSSPAASL